MLSRNSGDFSVDDVELKGSITNCKSGYLRKGSCPEA
jgi:hypothetical protein